MEVFQDADAALTRPVEGDDIERTLRNALQPLHSTNMQLNPSMVAASGASPTKPNSSPLRPVSSHSLTDIKIPPPPQPSFVTDSPYKQTRFYSMYQPLPPLQPDFAQFRSALSYEKENYYEPNSFHGLPIVPCGDYDFGYDASLKRPLPDSALGRDRLKKQKTDNEELVDLPDPRELPLHQDDGSKPPHSYAELIGMAILRSPNRRLTLAQIYKWISDHFSFYKATDSGWQNSIRHNLSLNKNFVKQERPKDDPGKGNYWAIKPGEERTFLLNKKNPIRRLTNPDGSQYIHGLPTELDYSFASTPAISHFTLAPNPIRRSESRAIDSAKFPDDADLSSEGTIPASDPVQDDDKGDVAAMMMPPPVTMRSSPPPADLGSSPPAVMSQTRRGTPPPEPRYPNSRSGNQRRKFAGMNDSGYWSSIESSVARGPTQLLTSEADASRLRHRKGRAETEIARIRSSSVDSPTKELLNIRAAASQFASSSPNRDENPLTPAVVFKRPAKPPPSVSPNTNLRDHRNRMRALLGTPARVFSPAPPVPNVWSPAFNIGDDGTVALTPYMSPYKAARTPWRLFEDTPGSTNKNLFNAAFDIFIDAPEEDLSSLGSPETRSVRRPMLARAATSTSILADITRSSKSNSATLAPPMENMLGLSPYHKRPRPLRSPAKIGSPLKQSHLAITTAFSPPFGWQGFGTGTENARPLDNTDEALFGVHLPSDGSEEAIDIFQDFGKIGEASQLGPVANRANGSPVKRTMGPPARPALARSNTSRW